MQRKRIAIIVFLLLLCGVGLLVYLGQRERKQGELFYSGTIEATQPNLAFQAGGRVTHVFAWEGPAVAAGQVLAELDRSESEACWSRPGPTCSGHGGNKNNWKPCGNFTEKRCLKTWRERKRALRAQLEELQAGNRAQDVGRAHQAFLAADSVRDEANRDRERYDQPYPAGLTSEKERDIVKLKSETAFRDYERRAREAYDLADAGARRETIAVAL